jgi:hypothetical protein
MVTRKQKREMVDYFAANLRGNGRVEPRRREVLKGSGIESSYILLGKNEGVVFLVDQTYPKNSFREVYHGMKNCIPNVAPVFYKDGQTFFRSAVAGEEKTGIESKQFKSSKDLSLKNYGSDDLHRMISLRPEEHFVSRSLGKWVQYYQPESERLEKALVACKFKPVVFDYSHIPPDQRFGDETKESERLSIWREKKEIIGNLGLDNGYLVGRPISSS